MQTNKLQQKRATCWSAWQKSYICNRYIDYVYQATNGNASCYKSVRPNQKPDLIFWIDQALPNSRPTRPTQRNEKDERKFTNSHWAAKQIHRHAWVQATLLPWYWKVTSYQSYLEIELQEGKPSEYSSYLVAVWIAKGQFHGKAGKVRCYGYGRWLRSNWWRRIKTLITCLKTQKKKIIKLILQCW